MTGLTLTAGVFVLSFRTARAELGDGPIGFAGELIVGLTLLPLPFGIAVYRAAQRSNQLTVLVGLITVAAAVVVAAAAPGNLTALIFPVVLIVAIGLVWLAEAVLRKLAKPPNPPIAGAPPAACAGHQESIQPMYTERSKVTPNAATAARTLGESVTPKPGASFVTRANIMKPSTSRPCWCTACLTEAHNLAIGSSR